MSSTIIRMVSLSVVSLIAIVPDSECRTPILIVPWVWASAAPPSATAAPTATTAASAARQIPLMSFIAPSFFQSTARRPDGRPSGWEQDRGQAGRPSDRGDAFISSESIFLRHA
jgi:hypothetical protein